MRKEEEEESERESSVYKEHMAEYPSLVFALQTKDMMSQIVTIVTGSI